MNNQRLLAAVERNPRNVRFAQLQSLIEAFGFALHRVNGSHHIYARPDVDDLINVQPDRNGKAKAYQVRQFLDIVERHGLSLEDAS